MTLKEEFLQAVKDGKINGLEWVQPLNPIFPAMLRIDGELFSPDIEEPAANHVCGILRRWLKEKGWAFELTHNGFCVHPFAHVGPPPFQRDIRLVSELDAHQDAALWVLEQEEK